VTRTSRLGEEHDLALGTVVGPFNGAQHLQVMNRRIVLTPFHDMLLIAPQTANADVHMLAERVEALVAEVRA
jgi:glutamate-1-semialdehyde 2,1-aminomutase